MSDQLRLGGTSTRRVVGPAERDLGTTLRAWRAAGHLAGPEHAATRNTLRESARNADRALALIEAGDDRAPSPYAYAMIRRIHDELLRLHAPPAVAGADPLDAFGED